MDPQHRMILQCAVRAWQQAGCPDLEGADLFLAISSTSDHRCVNRFSIQSLESSQITATINFRSNIEKECKRLDENFWIGTTHSVFSGLAAKVNLLP